MLARPSLQPWLAPDASGRAMLSHLDGGGALFLGKHSPFGRTGSALLGQAKPFWTEGERSTWASKALLDGPEALYLGKQSPFGRSGSALLGQGEPFLLILRLQIVSRRVANVSAQPGVGVRDWAAHETPIRCCAGG